MPVTINPAPVLQSATPTHDGIPAIVNADIVLKFSANMVKGNGTITISDGYTQSYIGRDGLLHTRLIGATDTRTFSVMDSQVSISGDTVTINPTNNLKANLVYSVQMGAGVLRDTAGHAWGGLSDSSKLNFTTIQGPAASITSASLSADTGLYNDDGVTSVAAQTIHGNYAGELATGQKIQVSLNGGGSWSYATVAEASHSWSLGATLAGSGSMLARIVDARGVPVHTFEASDYTVDTTAPTVSMAGVAPVLTGHSDALTNDKQPVVTVDFNGKTGLVIGDTVEIRDANDGNALVGVYTLSGDDLDSYGGVSDYGTLDIKLDHLGHTLSDGMHNLVVQIGDLAGNAPGAAGSPLSITVDATRPAATINLGLDFLGSGGPMVVTGGISEPLKGGEFVEYSIDGGQTWAHADTSGSSWTTASVTLGMGATIGLRVIDEAGNGADAAHTVFIGDGYGGTFEASKDTVLYAKDGDDTINVTDVIYALLNGGSGKDTLNMTGSGKTLTLSAVSTALKGIDAIALNDNGNALVLTSTEIDAISDFKALTIEGGSTDTVTLSDANWIHASTNAGYATYTHGATTLVIDIDIQLMGVQLPA